VKRHPKDLHARAGLPEIWRDRAQVYARLERLSDAIADQQAVVAEEERLVREANDPAHWRNSLADGVEALGQLHRQAGQQPQAEGTYLRALQIREALAREQPGEPGYQSSLAGLHNHLGIYYFDVNNTSKSEAHYRQAIAVGTKNVGDVWQRAQLAGYHCNLGHTLRRQSQPEPAIAEYTKAARLLEALWTDPDLAPGVHRTVRSYLGNTYMGRLAVFTQAGRLAEALADQERLLQIDPERHGELVLFVRALTLARLGVSARAVAEADALARRPKLTSGQCYNLAGAYARAGRPERALEWLGKARAAGYFADPTVVEQLRQDGDFEALKARPEFQKFLAELAR
jgi:tetratricopeptide (TPR) repeat protein